MPARPTTGCVQPTRRPRGDPPAEPSPPRAPPRGRGRGAARRDPGALPRHPRRSRAGLRGAHAAAMRCAERLARPRLRRGAARRPAGDGGPRARWPAGVARARAPRRHPGRVRRAARPGSWLRPQHDGRQRRRRGASPWPRSRPSCAARSSSSARPPRSAARASSSCSTTACSRALTRHSSSTPATATTSLVAAARERGRRGDLHRPPGARRHATLAGPQRARRAGPALHLDRPVAPAAAPGGTRPRHRHRGRHGRQHHPRPRGRPLHGPQPRPGLLRGSCGSASGRWSRPPRWRPACEGGDRLLGRLVHDHEGQRHARRLASGPTCGRRRRRRCRARPGSPGQHRHGQRQPCPADHPPRLWPSARRACPATPRASATRRPRRVPTRRPCSRRRSWPRRPTSCSPSRRWSKPPGVSSGRSRCTRAARLAVPREPRRPAGPPRRVYDLDLADDPGDLDLYLALAEREGGPILELGAGSGRLAVPLAAAGHEVTAVDVDPAMLARAARGLGHARGPMAARRRGAVSSSSQGDLLTADLGARFGLAHPGPQQPLFLMHPGRQAAALAALARHLRPGGLAVVDVWLPARRGPGRATTAASGPRVAAPTRPTGTAWRSRPAPASTRPRRRSTLTTWFDAWPSDGGPLERIERQDRRAAPGDAPPSSSSHGRGGRPRVPRQLAGDYRLDALRSWRRAGACSSGAWYSPAVVTTPPDQIRLLLVEDVPQVAQYVRNLLNAQQRIKLLDIQKDGRHVLEQIRQVRPDVLMSTPCCRARSRACRSPSRSARGRPRPAHRHPDRAPEPDPGGPRVKRHRPGPLDALQRLRLGQLLIRRPSRRRRPRAENAAVASTRSMPPRAAWARPRSPSTSPSRMPSRPACARSSSTAASSSATCGRC